MVPRGTLSSPEASVDVSEMPDRGLSNVSHRVGPTQTASGVPVRRARRNVVEDDSTTPDTRRAAGLPRDFNWLWAGQAISEWGTQLTVLALPIIAITALSATTFHVGLLMTMENLATPLIGLFVGVYVDRVRRRPVLIAADIGRMLVLGAVVALWFSHTLGLVHLYLAAGLIGVFTVFFTVGYH